MMILYVAPLRATNDANLTVSPLMSRLKKRRGLGGEKAQTECFSVSEFSVKTDFVHRRTKVV